MICYFLFYNKAVGKQAHLAFNKDFLHCDIIVFDGEHYFNLTFSNKGLDIRLLQVSDSLKLCRVLKIIDKLTALIVVNVDEKHKKIWTPLWIKSCNEVIRYYSGVDIGITLTPAHLHNKLLRYNKRSNYEILYAWMRKPANHKEVRNGWYFWRWRRRCGRIGRHAVGANKSDSGRNTTQDRLT